MMPKENDIPNPTDSQEKHVHDDVELQEVDLHPEATEQSNSNIRRISATKNSVKFDNLDNNNEHQNENEKSQKKEFKMINAPMREVSISGGIFSKHALAFNPLTSFIGFALLWGAAIWCMSDPAAAQETLKEVRGQVSLNFTWIIIASKPITVFFLLFIGYKYGHIKLGKKDEEPEFSGLTYFSMLFSAGVAVGIFYYGVSEPLWHQQSNWYSNSGFHSQDEIDQFAMNQTILHWGLQPWAIYLTVAIAAALGSFRFNLPLTFRSCFYPILGEYTWGWIGDLIDGFSIVVSVAGVCASLGVGAIQITSGLQRIGVVSDDLSDSDVTQVRIATIWVITTIATASVLSGLNLGMKYLSMMAFSLGMILTLVVFLTENSSYLLNLMTQTTGYYFQYSIFQIPFHTDAFGQLREGEGRAIDGGAAESWWLDGWTILYWNWWASWAAFVGLFVARISRGRTIGQVVLYSLFVPLFYCILWFGVWGGTGLRQQRQALELEQLGQTYFNDSTYFRQDGNEFCYDVPQQDVVMNGTAIFTNYLQGITPVCKLDKANQETAAFNVLYSFSFPEDFATGYGPILTGMFIIALSIYFATSSDSGSLIVDFLASNGRLEHHWLQRLFWALTEGAVATALLSAGGSVGLDALQAAAVICGFPFTIFLLYILQSIYELCEQATNEDQEYFEFKTRKEFETPVYGGIFNIFEYIASAGNVHPERQERGMALPTREEVVEFLQGLLVPFYSVYRVLSNLYPESSSRVSNIIVTILYTVFHVVWITLFVMTISSKPGLRTFAWTVYILNCAILTGMKMHYRTTRKVHGNIVGDFVSSFLLWPQVLTQLNIGLRNECCKVSSSSQFSLE